MWLKSQLDAIDPRLFYLCVTLVAFGLVYAWKKLYPKSFAELPEALQAMPAILLGALLSAQGNASDVGKAMLGALFGALSGLAAVGTHVALKKSSLPYGNLPEKKED
jgi:hypothetical protein